VSDIEPASTSANLRGGHARLRLGACGALLALALATHAADLEEAQQSFRSGNYTQSVAIARQALADHPYSEDLEVSLANSLLALGQYPEAHAIVTNALEHGYPSPRLRWVAHEVLLCNGQTEAASDLVDKILQMTANGRLASRDAKSLVAVGQAALLKGVEPKLVLDRMFEVAKKFDPDSREVYLAIGELALDKHDYALAAKTFQEGLKRLPDDPDLLFDLARAYSPNQQRLMIETLEAALKRNSNHIDSLLLLADHSIDAEAYADAADFLDRARRVNPWHPSAWAYRTVLALLQNQPEAASSAREKALKFWPTNPRVPYLIGLKLSQKYRFAEGSESQQQALNFDGDYLPAKAQLAQDLLRLGKEAEGWRLADEVQKADGYNITANNLMSLHDTMQKFQIITNEHFILRMSPHEAALYGSSALELLESARAKLCAKYEYQLAQPTLVEVFTNQADFAVRTFALPQNDGYLGVCFGDVITANSPGAYPGHPFNWKAMLWHEFCHVITLNLTHNRMPRWLSEGISVYEEHQTDQTWGEHINPRYREMMLEGELTPISRLSAAFLMPKSQQHLQFAYYESSLVIQFLVERHGFEKLLAILHDLGQDSEINHAITNHTGPMETLEKDFAAYAKQTAERMAPGLDWEKPDLGARVTTRRQAEERLSLDGPGPDQNGFSWEIWAQSHPTNYYAMMGQAEELTAARKWAEAKPILKRLVELYPDSTGPQSAYQALASAHHALGETNDERSVLSRFAEHDDAATDAYGRLMELGHEARDWSAVALNAQRYRAVNPLVPAPYRFLAEASEKTGDTPRAIEAYRAQLELDPSDPAEVHFHLASLLNSEGDPAARRHVLQALEEAPRYRNALLLLLKINKKETAESRTPSSTSKP
jgi:tetratricopeptide (TPR) repeat protein